MAHEPDNLGDQPVPHTEKRQVECLPLFACDKLFYVVFPAAVTNQTAAMARRLTSTVPGCIADYRPDRCASRFNRSIQEASVLILSDKLNRRLIPRDVKGSGRPGADIRAELVRAPIIAVGRREIEMANLRSGIIHHSDCQGRRGCAGKSWQRGQRTEHGDQHQKAKAGSGI